LPKLLGLIMAIFRNPASFTKIFKIGSPALDSLGILNPIINVDTRLFIDPVLLDTSGQPEIFGQASAS